MTTTTDRPTLVVAGLSARLMAEAAARDGFDVIALDAFSDADTRRAALRWQSIRGAGAVQLDGGRLLAALAEAATERPRPIGWVAGSDLEGEPELLARGHAVLPLIGTAPDDVRRVRDPAGFFSALQALGLPHPETRLEPPGDARGWLCKHARSAGGWHIRPANHPGAAEPDRHPYYQRDQTGTPMSVLFVGNGHEARRLGCHALIVRPLGAHPHIYRGAVGPLTLPEARLQALDEALQSLTRAFSLRGLASLDVIDDGRQFQLLEINPRPSASMGLHTGALMRAHVDACLDGRLPPPPVAGEARSGLRGSETVFAPAALQLSDAQAAALAARADCHDLPAARSRFEAGDPVCSLTATGSTVGEVRASLDDKRRALRAALKSGGALPAADTPGAPPAAGALSG